MAQALETMPCGNVICGNGYGLSGEYKMAALQYQQGCHVDGGLPKHRINGCKLQDRRICLNIKKTILRFYYHLNIRTTELEGTLSNPAPVKKTQ